MKTHKCTPKDVEIKISIPDNIKRGGAFDELLINSFKKAGVKIDKTRYTYVVSSKHGTAEMPHGLLCAMFIIDHFREFDWMLSTKFSGKYTFKFDGEYTY